MKMAAAAAFALAAGAQAQESYSFNGSVDITYSNPIQNAATLVQLERQQAASEVLQF